MDCVFGVRLLLDMPNLQRSAILGGKYKIVSNPLFDRAKQEAEQKPFSHS